MDYWDIKQSVQVSPGPKCGGVHLGEFIVKWDYNGEGNIVMTLTNSDDKFIQSIEHTKSKI